MSSLSATLTLANASSSYTRPLYFQPFGPPATAESQTAITGQHAACRTAIAARSRRRLGDDESIGLGSRHAQHTGVTLTDRRSGVSVEKIGRAVRRHAPLAASHTRSRLLGTGHDDRATPREPVNSLGLPFSSVETSRNTSQEWASAPSGPHTSVARLVIGNTGSPPEYRAPVAQPAQRIDAATR